MRFYEPKVSPNQSVFLRTLAKHLSKTSIRALFVVARILLTAAKKMSKANAAPEGKKSVGIEAGQVAWAHIEFEELNQTAVESFGDSHVFQLKVSSRQAYLREFRRFLSLNPVSHYLFDPRTGSQRAVRGMFEAFCVGIVLARKRITPIVFCTDISLRLHRAKASVITAVSGVIVCFMESSIASTLLPHPRLIGPIPMPISKKTISFLRPRIRFSSRYRVPVVSFFGSLYEPRTSYLREIQKMLAKSGVDFQFSGRKDGEDRISNQDYWNRLLASDILITTSDQGSEGGRSSDLVAVNQMVFRLSEGLASGSCVLMERAPGIERYFKEGRDFIGWSEPEEAAKRIVNLVSDSEWLETVRRSGHEALSGLVEEGFFWATLISASELEHHGA